MCIQLFPTRNRLGRYYFVVDHSNLYIYEDELHILTSTVSNKEYKGHLHIEPVLVGDGLTRTSTFWVVFEEGELVVHSLAHNNPVNKLKVGWVNLLVSLTDTFMLLGEFEPCSHSTCLYLIHTRDIFNPTSTNMVMILENDKGIPPMKLTAGTIQFGKDGEPISLEQYYRSRVICQPTL